jgi:hypothetical protein
MNMERINHKETVTLLPIHDGKVQAAIAEYAFKKEHPAEAAAPRNHIMTTWISEHAADWRAVVETHEGDVILPEDLKNPDVMARYYDEMLRVHESSDNQTLH